MRRRHAAALVTALTLVASPLTPQALDFFTLAPCRLVDTRGPAGPQGGPALQSGVPRALTLINLCGVPPRAQAVSLNITAVAASAGGFITGFPGDQTLPGTNTISFAAGHNRANNTVLGLAANGTGALSVQSTMSGDGTVDLIVDVNGYFRGLCGLVDAGEDPENECGEVGCNGFYGGFAGDTCHRKADVAAAQARCDGAGACRTAAAECTAQSEQGAAELTCHDLCQEPTAGSCAGTTPGACASVDPGTKVDCGIGACANSAPSCVNGAPGVCTPLPNATDEVCDGLDNDCDGLVDSADPTLAGPTSNPCAVQGECGGIPIPQQCVEGAWKCNYQAAIISSGRDIELAGDPYTLQPSELLCDSKDGNCNGLIDLDGYPTKFQPCGSSGGVLVCNTSKSGLICSSP